MGSKFCTDTPPPEDLTSQYGGFYANSIPFNCSTKETFVILAIVQLLIAVSMYSYHLYEKRQLKEGRTLGHIQSNEGDGYQIREFETETFDQSETVQRRPSFAKIYQIQDEDNTAL